MTSTVTAPAQQPAQVKISLVEDARFIDRRNNDGDTALMLSCRAAVATAEGKQSDPKSYACLFALIRHGASLLIPDAKGQFPWQVCQCNDVRACLEWLASYQVYERELNGDAEFATEFRATHWSKTMKADTTNFNKEVFGQSSGGGPQWDGIRALEYLEKITGAK